MVIICCNAQYGPYWNVKLININDGRLAVWRDHTPGLPGQSMIGYWMVVNDQYLQIQSVWGTDEDWWNWRTSPTYSVSTSLLSYAQIQFCATNPCPEACSVVHLSGDFMWSEYEGLWWRFPDTYQGGAPVYYKSAYGVWQYLWKETDFTSDAWVIGYDYNANLYWNWGWGSDLFGSLSWLYWSGSSWEWDSDAGNGVCYPYTNAAAVLLPSDRTDPDTVSANDTQPGLGGDMFSVPVHANVTETGSAVFSIVAAVAVIAILVMMIVVTVFVKRKRKGAKRNEEGRAIPNVVHVPDTSTKVVVEEVTEKAVVNEVDGGNVMTVPNEGTDGAASITAVE